MPIDIEKLIKEFKAQYLPDGNIELLSLEQEKYHEYYECGFSISNAEVLLLKKQNLQVLVRRIADDILVELTADTTTCNLGILKNVSRKLITKINNNSG